MSKFKKQHGQYFTKGHWLNKSIKKIIGIPTKVMDPCAGAGDLNIFDVPFKGYDIDPKLGWEVNNAIKSVPKFDGTIITNPPYLGKVSAARNGLKFPKTHHSDIYKIVLDNCRKSADKVVAIVPETIISTGYLNNIEFSFVDVIENNPFNDTSCPVCVVGFGFNNKKSVYKNGKFVMEYTKLKSLDIYSRNNDIKFNNADSKYTFKLIDGTSSGDRIKLYPRIKGRSSLITDRAYCNVKTNDLIDIDIVNKKLEKFRSKSNDLLLSPYMGNNNKGVRRRRLTIAQAKSLIEKALNDK